MLVPIIENRDVDKYDYYIDYYLNDFKDVDALILGCTHYISLKDKIAKYLNKEVINMADYIIKEIPNKSIPNLKLYFSYINENIRKNTKEIIGNYKIERKEL